MGHPRRQSSIFRNVKSTVKVTNADFPKIRFQVWVGLGNSEGTTVTNFMMEKLEACQSLVILS